MKKKFWNFKMQAEDTAELLLYGPISDYSWWGDEIIPKQFAEDLKALGDIKTINVRINSGGGDVFAGQTIYSLLKSHKAHVNVYIDGLAASIASVVAMAGDTVYVRPGSMIMIHNPWSSVWGGDANDFRHMADVLDKVRDAIVSVYKVKTGLSEEELKQMMDEETWMSAQEAIEKKFADVLLEDVKVAASVTKDRSTMILNGVTFDLSKYRRASEALSKMQLYMKGDEVMNFEEFLASLPEEQRQMVQSAVENAKQEAIEQIEASFDEERTQLQNQIDSLQEQIKKLQEDGSGSQEEDLLANVDPTIRAMIEEARRKEAEARAELQRIQDERELEHFRNIAASFDRLPIQAEVFAPIFRNFAKADKEGFEKLQALLKAVNECVEKGYLFKSVGTQKNTDGLSAWERAQLKAKDLMQSNPKLSEPEALMMVFKEDPVLYDEYTKELIDNPNAGNIE